MAAHTVTEDLLTDTEALLTDTEVLLTDTEALHTGTEVCLMALPATEATDTGTKTREPSSSAESWCPSAATAAVAHPSGVREEASAASSEAREVCCRPCSASFLCKLVTLYKNQE